MAEQVKLGLCTSGSRLKIAVEAGGKIFQAQKKIFNQEQALFGLVKRELAKAGADLGSVDVVCAVRGPGRFTGIRISLTLAGALKAMAGAKVYTATLFEILALQACEHKDFKDSGLSRIAVLLHAFKDEYFCQFFKAAAGRKLPQPEGEPLWLKSGELKEQLAAETIFYAIGDSEEDPAVYGLLPAGCARAPKAISKVLPGHVIKAAMALRNKTLKPLYLKPAKYELENK
jgi:tRNA threonylcarbamoyl adenosine modification protein YeaZ